MWHKLWLISSNRWKIYKNIQNQLHQRISTRIYFLHQRHISCRIFKNIVVHFQRNFPLATICFIVVVNEKITTCSAHHVPLEAIYILEKIGPTLCTEKLVYDQFQNIKVVFFICRVDIYLCFPYMYLCIFVLSKQAHFTIMLTYIISHFLSNY